MGTRKYRPWRRCTLLVLALGFICAAPAAAIDVSGDYATLLPSNLGACVLTLTQDGSNLAASGCDLYDTTATVDSGTGAFTVTGSFGSTLCGPGTGLSGTGDGSTISGSFTCGPPNDYDLSGPFFGSNCARVDDCARPSEPSAKLVLRTGVTRDSTGKLDWTWGRGTATAIADFGDPTASTGYVLCVAAALPGGALRPIVVEGLSSGTGWKRTLTGFKFSSRSVPGKRALLKSGNEGKARIHLTEHGFRLDSFADLDMTNPLAQVHLRASNGRCWAAVFDNPPPTVSATEIFGIEGN